VWGGVGVGRGSIDEEMLVAREPRGARVAREAGYRAGLDRWVEANNDGEG
jgi:hypothetical protein